MSDNSNTNEESLPEEWVKLIDALFPNHDYITKQEAVLKEFDGMRPNLVNNNPDLVAVQHALEPFVEHLQATKLSDKMNRLTGLSTLKAKIQNELNSRTVLKSAGYNLSESDRATLDQENTKLENNLALIKSYEQ